MRLIDADALIEFIENRYVITWKDDYEGGIKDACTDILEKISKMPTIEPERKRGKWLEMAGDLQCSECGATYHDLYPDYSDTKFCPNCGSYNGGENDQSK